MSIKIQITGTADINRKRFVQSGKQPENDINTRICNRVYMGDSVHTCRSLQRMKACTPADFLASPQAIAAARLLTRHSETSFPASRYADHRDAPWSTGQIASAAVETLSNTLKNDLKVPVTTAKYGSMPDLIGLH